jgi:hypothetical protein
MGWLKISDAVPVEQPVHNQEVFDSVPLESDVLENSQFSLKEVSVLFGRSTLIDSLAFAIAR